LALVEVERRDRGVVLVTLNDPDRRNAMTVAMGEAIAATFAGLADDTDVRVIVLTGAGSAFSAGGDLAMLEDHARRTREEGFDATAEMRGFYQRFLTVRDVPVPVIAAINGHAVGAGLCVALACDLAYVAERAKVGLNFARLALHPGMGGSWLLPRAVGQQRAAELLYTGRLASGSEAAGYGMALAALPAEAVLGRALELADEIALSSPQVVRQLKTSLAAAPTTSLAEQLELEAANQAVNYGTADFTEGLAAGRERRTPDFTGD
jgi:enoyl-CoA hydratase